MNELFRCGFGSWVKWCLIALAVQVLSFNVVIGQTNLPSGTMLWTYLPLYPDEYSCDGLVASPVVGDNGLVYAFGISAFHACDGATGTSVWKTNLLEFGYPYLMPGCLSAGANGMLYANSAFLYAIDGGSGAILWRSPLASSALSYPSIDEDHTLVTATYTNILLELNPETGESHQLQPFRAGQISLGTDSFVYATKGSNIFAYNRQSGATLWNYQADSEITMGQSPALGADGAIYIFTSNQCLTAVDTLTGTERWRFQTGGITHQSPVIGEDNTVFLLSDDGYFYALEGATGRLKWTFNHGGTAVASPAIAADGTVWFAANATCLYALDASNGSVKWKSDKLNASSSGGYSSMIIHTNQTAYCIWGSQLAALACGAGPAPSAWPMAGQNAQHANRQLAIKAPVILTEPQDQSVLPGCNALIKVATEANGAIAYRWQKDGVDLVTGGQITGAETAWLQVKQATAENAGQYRVVISNTLGQVTSKSVSLQIVSAQPGLLRWKFGTGRPLTNAPVLGANGMLYLKPTDGNIYALNSTNGDKAWQFVTEPFIWDADGWGIVNNGPETYDRAGLILGANGWIFSGGPASGNVYAIDAQTGGQHWVKKLAATNCFSPAIGTDGTLYLGSGDTNVIAIDGPSGAVKWTFSSDAACESIPVIGLDGTVFVGSTSGVFYALDPATGNSRWHSFVGYSLSSTPAISSQGTLFVGAEDGQVSAITSASGQILWQFTAGGAIHSSPAIGLDGTVYVGSDDHQLYALNPDTGEKKWSYATDGAVSDPAVAADGTIYVGTSSGKLLAVDGASGNLKWSYLAGGAITSVPLIGPNGCVFVASHDGWIYAFEGSAALAKSAWPMAGHDVQSSHRATLAAASTLRFDQATQADGQIQLHWIGNGTLQSAENPNGPWSDLTATSESTYQATAAGTQRFYRLKQTQGQ